MSGVQFSEPNWGAAQGTASASRSPFVRWLTRVSHGHIQTEAGAKMILIIFSIFCLLTSGLIYFLATRQEAIGYDEEIKEALKQVNDAGPHEIN